MDLISKIIDKNILLEIYHDLAQPGVQKVGNAIGALLGLGNTILLPLYLANEKAAVLAKRNLDCFRRKLDALDAHSITEPSPEVAVPILEKLMYVQDENIAELYAALLTNSCNSDTVSPTHPAFTHVIARLTPDEAKILRWLTKHSIIPYETLRISGDKKVFDRRKRIVAFSPDMELTHPDKCSLYAENFVGLGLLEDSPVALALKSHYKYVTAINTPYIRKWKKELPGQKITRIRGCYRLTTFGQEFLIACGFNTEADIDRLRRWR